jgi:hypothetical protein
LYCIAARTTFHRNTVIPSLKPNLAAAPHQYTYGTIRYGTLSTYAAHTLPYF